MSNQSAAEMCDEPVTCVIMYMRTSLTYCQLLQPSPPSEGDTVAAGAGKVGNDTHMHKDSQTRSSFACFHVLLDACLLSLVLLVLFASCVCLLCLLLWLVLASSLRACSAEDLCFELCTLSLARPVQKCFLPLLSLELAHDLAFLTD